MQILNVNFHFKVASAPPWALNAGFPSSILPPSGGWESTGETKLGERREQSVGLRRGRAAKSTLLTVCTGNGGEQRHEGR